jgi:hypothetical protein
MVTKRTRTERPIRFVITPLAIAAFQRMQQLEEECTCEEIDWGGEYWKHESCAACEEWWHHHATLHDELKLRPWEWPAVEHPEAESPYPEGSNADRNWKPDLEARERYRLLEIALKEMEFTPTEPPPTSTAPAA